MLLKTCYVWKLLDRAGFVLSYGFERHPRAISLMSILPKGEIFMGPTNLEMGQVQNFLDNRLGDRGFKFIHGYLEINLDKFN